MEGDLPQIFELVEHVLAGIVDVDADVTRVEVLHIELITEGTNEESAYRVQRRDFIR